jgi:4-amino-4-deoxy-L-arabinose transferase-like glycosyltransferase
VKQTQLFAHRAEQKLFIPLWLVWFAAIGFIFAALGSYGILDNNEGLYAEIPREMLAGHDWRLWVIPHLNGLPYMEKPPLLYWLTALSFSIFGVSEWSARLAPALSSLACVAMLLRFGSSVQRPQAGRLAALMFVGGVGVAQMSRTLMFDMLLTACLTGALMCAFLYARQQKPGLLRLAYAALALALMAKGVVALLLFGLVVGVFLLPTLLGRGGLMAVCRAWLRPDAILIFLLIAAPWHIAASMVEPIFPWFYFINEHVLRFLGKREPHDYYAGPWWYYLPRMVLYLFPWSLLLLGLIQRRSSHAEDAGGDETRTLSRFLLLAWLLPLLFFSVSSAKANYYLVVVMPFAALQIALALEQRDFLAPRWRVAPGLLLALLAGAAACYLLLHGARLGTETAILGLSTLQFVIGGLIALSMSGFLAAFLAGWQSRVGVTSYVLPAALCASALLVAINAIEPQVSNRPLAQYLQHEMAGRPVYLYRNFEELSSLPFYLGHPVNVIDSRSNDLYWGNKLQPNDLLIDDAQFIQAESQHPVAVIVMQRQMADFRASPHFARFKGQKLIGSNTIFYN